MANVSALDVLKQALKTYRAEIKIDSKKQSIDIYPEVGNDKGVYFSDQLNLRKLTVQYSTYDFYTEIEPYGKDGLTIETVNSGKTYLENHQYSSKKKRCIWKDERYTITDSLKEDSLLSGNVSRTTEDFNELHGYNQTVSKQLLRLDIG